MEDLWVDFRYRWVSPLTYDVCMIHVMFQVSPVSMFRNNSPFGCDTSSYADSLQSKYVFWQFFIWATINWLIALFIYFIQRFKGLYLGFCFSVTVVIPRWMKRHHGSQICRGQVQNQFTVSKHCC